MKVNWLRRIRSFQGAQRQFLTCALTLLASYVPAEAETLSISNDWNRVYDPAPPNLTTNLGRGLPNFNSVVLFAGGFLTNAEGLHWPTTTQNAPTDGTYYLVRSVFGHPVGPVGPADVWFGDPILPDRQLGVDLSIAPIIVPEGKAFYVPEQQSVIACDPGYVDITWFRSPGVPNAAVRYLISDRVNPANQVPVVALYHTHNYQPGETNSFIHTTALPDACKVDVTALSEVIPHYNSAIPSRTNLLKGADGKLWASQAIGLLVLEYRSNGTFAGTEIVDVRRFGHLDGSPSPVDLGARCLPFTEVPSALAVIPFVSRGANDQDLNQSYVYQHNVPASAQNGHVWATRKTAELDQIEIYWKRKSVQNVIWPYEMHRYTADWGSNYQVYVRAAKTTSESDVHIPSTLRSATPIRFAEPDGHATFTSNNAFSTAGPGMTLLHLQQSNSVIFQVVRSVDHHDARFNLTPLTWDIGKDISDPHQQGAPPLYSPGYIHRPEGNRYDAEIYDGRTTHLPDWDPSWTTRQIIPINTGTLEIWWWNLNSNTAPAIQWPSMVKRYNSVWPKVTEEIVIASQQSWTIPSTYQNATLYYQNEETESGFNPNDEHGWIEGKALYAARSDLGTNDTSLPYMLIKHQDPSRQWVFDVVHVVAERPPDITFNYEGGKVGGGDFGSPAPISELKGPNWLNYLADYGVAGPYWKDRKNRLWARAAGDDGNPTNIVVRYFYPIRSGFYFPPHYLDYFPAELARTNTPLAGTLFPWLDLHGTNLPTVPQDITYSVRWPADTDPEMILLDVGQTLLSGTFQAGTRALQSKSVDVLYQQSLMLNKGYSAGLYAPKLGVVVTNVILPQGITESENTAQIFPTLPSSLRTRLTYNPAVNSLTFSGELFDTSVEPMVLPNVLSLRDIEWLQKASQNAAYQAAIPRLIALSVPRILGNDRPFDPGDIALETSTGTGVGYVTLALNNSTNTQMLSIGEQDGIMPTLQVARVLPILHTGAIKTVRRLTDSPVSDKLTLRFNGDFGGRPDDYEFKWEFSKNGIDGWKTFTVAPRAGAPASEPVGRGAVEITIQGPGPATLSDHFFRCQYKRLTPHSAISTNTWTAWTAPVLAEGWIKRALAALNLFDQRYKDLRDGVDSRLSPIAVAGRPWNGQVPFNREAVETAGLIELYETILRYGINLSLEGAPPLAYDPVGNYDIYQALILAASRLSDLYTMLGNEAYADASDPTIAIGADFNRAASAMFCFEGPADIPNLLTEELCLLRGRTPGSAATGTTNPPVFNRMFWNFTRGIGDVAYVNNYHVRAFGTNGGITAVDAAAQYPQGHGDAWGHYLTAVKNFYRLLTAENFAWTTTHESILVPNVGEIKVNYQYERQFATAAAAKAKTGAEILELTYRQNYREDPQQQYQGYPDTDPGRSWGVSDWASRVGQGAYIDWVVGNAMLPPSDDLPAPPGEQKVDRSTVLELREIAASFAAVQQHCDNMDIGLNPLGIAKNSIPFGLELATGGGFKDAKNHFEQVYDRAVLALNDAIGVFNHANEASQMLRRQADTEVEFRHGIEKQEQDYINRLIELFGRPYEDDIGPGRTYPSGYTGPDTEDFHFLFGDPSEAVGVVPRGSLMFTFTNRTSTILPDGNLAWSNHTATFYLSQEGYGMVKPPTWTGTRAAVGEIQNKQTDVFQLVSRYNKSLVDYDSLLAKIEDQAGLLHAQFDLNDLEVMLLYEGLNMQETLNTALRRSRDRQLDFQTKGRMATMNANAIAEGLPALTGFIAGLANGIMADLWGAARFAILQAGNRAAENATRNANNESLAELDIQQAKELQQTYQNIILTTNRQAQAAAQQIAQLQEFIRAEASQRLELYTTLDMINQAAANYRSAIARGQRLIEERQRFRQQTAEQVQSYRYRDMAFRIFRNDALQKYRAQFDLAAMYVYLAAKAYDYETCLLPEESAAGHAFLESIVKKRALGEVSSTGQPIGGTGQRDPGLADPLKSMKDSYAVLKINLGLGNPAARERLFSIRYGLFRIRGDSAGSSNWVEKLELSRVRNIWDIPEFRSLCRPPRSEPLGGEPGIVIEFPSMIYADKNYFGWPGGGGDNPYNPTFFAAKITSVGIWFGGYDSTSEGLSQTPYAFLIPVGLDRTRVPEALDFRVREWRVVDQKIPVPRDFVVDPSLISSVRIPVYDSLTDTFAEMRRFSAIDASVDLGTGALDTSKMVRDTRLLGRSVWNSRWLLIIPGVALAPGDPVEGIERFINGKPLGSGTRSGRGVSDIKLYFETYHYSGG